VRITALEWVITVGIATAAVLALRSWRSPWARPWLVTAMFAVMEMWMAEYRLKLIGAWEAAYWRDTRAIQRQMQGSLQAPTALDQSLKGELLDMPFVGSLCGDPRFSPRALRPLSRDLVSPFHPVRDLFAPSPFETLPGDGRLSELRPQSTDDMRLAIRGTSPEASRALCPYTRPENELRLPQRDSIRQGDNYQNDRHPNAGQSTLPKLRRSARGGAHLRKRTAHSRKKQSHSTRLRQQSPQKIAHGPKDIAVGPKWIAHAPKCLAHLARRPRSGECLLDGRAEGLLERQLEPLGESSDHVDGVRQSSPFG
jgi:hypothetical protein